MKDKVVYVHSIKGVPFYIGSGNVSRAADKNRSAEWNKIVLEANYEYNVEIVFRGTIDECLEIEDIYLEKYWDTLCNKNEKATSSSITLISPSLKNIKLKIGQSIKLARKKRKLTCGELSKLAGIDRTTLYNIELGHNCSIDALLNIFLILGFHNDFVKMLENDKIGDAMVKSELLK